METMRGHASAVLPRTGHASDDDQLEAIRQRGEQLTTLRWQHHLYLPDEDSVRDVEERAVRAGWSIARAEVMPAPYSGWMLRLFRHDVLTADLVTSTRDYLERLALGHSGHYDGWDALSAQPDPPLRSSKGGRSRRRRVFHRHLPAAV